MSDSLLGASLKGELTVPANMWRSVTTTSMTGQQAYQGRSYELLEENQKLLREVKDDLLPLKKWLIQTYPDIYKQYVALEELKEASK